MNYDEILKRLKSPPPEANPRPTRDIDMTKVTKKQEEAEMTESKESDAEEER
jgi:hypothetical protein